MDHFSNNQQLPSRSQIHGTRSGSEKGKKSNKKSDLVSFGVTIAISLAIVWLVHRFLFIPVIVDGKSMAPTLADQDHLIVSKVTTIDRFDVVIFPAPDDPKREYIKRVIGLPGDKIEYKNDILYVNDKAYEEPYLDEYKSDLVTGELLTPDFILEDIQGVSVVPEGQIFVLGDNRKVSHDGRQIGFIQQDKIIGEAKLRFWPLNKIGTIPTNGQEK
ncbi:signal peptidase I [Isobaculum melis]|uniref:Signal peptidase I n=1 Tax=Isobaculum melis TaxID=142588 RepID=A0A1H9RWY2_9LACT|nr:signal peptidase I [Isobaculum melis]SER77292.1 signal peptidase I [Isobaculum melis]